MLDDGAKDKGYVLLCVATPEEDCEVHAIEEVGGLQCSQSGCICFSQCVNRPGGWLLKGEATP